MENIPTVNLILHASVIALLLAATILAFVVWRIYKKRGISFFPYMGFIAFGLLFYAASEYMDMFTPVFKTGFGLHNYITELVLAAGLSMIFIGFRRIMKTFG